LRTPNFCHTLNADEHSRNQRVLRLELGNMGFTPSSSYLIREYVLAKTGAGKKIVPVKPYTKKENGHKVQVSAHRRSTPTTSKGKK
jgi:hypothetical protein